MRKGTILIVIFAVLFSATVISADLQLDRDVVITDKVNSTTDNFIFTKNTYDISSRLTHIGYDGTTIETVKTSISDKELFSDVFTDIDMKIIETKDGIKEYLYINKPLQISKTADTLWFGYEMKLPNVDIYYKLNRTHYEKWNRSVTIDSKKIKFFDGDGYLYRLPSPYIQYNSTHSETGYYRLQNDKGTYKLWVMFDTGFLVDAEYPLIVDPSVDTRIDIDDTGNGFANRAGSSKMRRLDRNSTDNYFALNYFHSSTLDDIYLIISEGTGSYTGLETAIHLCGSAGGILTTNKCTAPDFEIVDDVLYMSYTESTTGSAYFSKCNTASGCAGSAQWAGADGLGIPPYDDLEGNLANNIDVTNSSYILVTVVNQSTPDETSIIKWDGVAWSTHVITAGSADHCKQSRIQMNSTDTWYLLLRDLAGSDQTRFGYSTDEGANWYNADHSSIGSAPFTCASLDSIINEGGKHEPQDPIMHEDTLYAVDRDIDNKDGWFIKINSTGDFTQEISTIASNSISIGIDENLTLHTVHVNNIDAYSLNSTDGGETWNTEFKTQDTLTAISGAIIEEKWDDVNKSYLGYIFADDSGDDLYFSWLNVNLAGVVASDTTPPTWTTIGLNDTLICSYDYVNFTSSGWNDDRALDKWIFSINDTGSEVNATAIAFTSTNATENVTRITNEPNTFIEYRFFGNDSSGNENVTSTENFTVVLCTTNVTGTVTTAEGDTFIEFIDTEGTKMDFIIASVIALGVAGAIMIYLGTKANPTLQPVFIVIGLICIMGILVLTLNMENVNTDIATNRTIVSDNFTTENSTLNVNIPEQYASMYDLIMIIFTVVFIIGGIGILLITIIKYIIGAIKGGK